jgi:nucleoside triphosphatase
MAQQQFPEPTVGGLIFGPDGRLFLMRSHKWRDKYVVPGGKKRHFIFFDYTCRADSTAAVLNFEAEEYVWVSPQDALELPVDPYTARAIRVYLERQSAQGG